MPQKTFRDGLKRQKDLDFFAFHERQNKAALLRKTQTENRLWAPR